MVFFHLQNTWRAFVTLSRSWTFPEVTQSKPSRRWIWSGTFEQVWCQRGTLRRERPLLEFRHQERGRSGGTSSAIVWRCIVFVDQWAFYASTSEPFWAADVGHESVEPYLWFGHFLALCELEERKLHVSWLPVPGGHFISLEPILTRKLVIMILNMKKTSVLASSYDHWVRSDFHVCMAGSLLIFVLPWHCKRETVEETGNGGNPCSSKLSVHMIWLFTEFAGRGRWRIASRVISKISQKK